MLQRAFRRMSGVLLMLSGVLGCGTVTGIPSHGGGKRFAVEQELIAASARAALDSIDLSKLAGRSVRMVFSSIGGEGSGNLTGGRLSVDRLVRGDYTSGAPVRAETDGGISRTHDCRAGVSSWYRPADGRAEPVSEPGVHQSA